MGFFHFPGAADPARDDGTFDKKPIVPWQKTGGSRDPAEIDRWWRQYPNAVPATPAGKRSGMVLLDIDVKRPNEYGFDTLADLCKSILPETPIAHTLTGGVHLYFAINPKVEIRSSQGTKGLGRGLDVRGEGGLIVLPASDAYSWDPHYNLHKTPLMPAPAWLGHRQKQERATSDRRWFDPRRSSTKPAIASAMPKTALAMKC